MADALKFLLVLVFSMAMASCTMTLVAGWFLFFMVGWATLLLTVPILVAEVAFTVYVSGFLR